MVVALLFGWYLLSGDNSELTAEQVYVEFVMEDEINALEADLAEIETAVNAGTLSEEEATAAKVRILTRLNEIDASSNVQASALTPSQRMQLSAGLDRLRNILVTYQATLESVDELADAEEVEAEVSARRRGGSSNGSVKITYTGSGMTLTEIVEEITDSVEELKETVDEMAEEEAADSEKQSDENTQDAPADDTEPETEDAAASEDEMGDEPSDETNTGDDMDSEDDTEVSASTTVDSELEIELGS